MAVQLMGKSLWRAKFSTDAAVGNTTMERRPTESAKVVDIVKRC